MASLAQTATQPHCQGQTHAPTGGQLGHWHLEPEPKNIAVIAGIAGCLLFFISPEKNAHNWPKKNHLSRKYPENIQPQNSYDYICIYFIQTFVMIGRIKRKTHTLPLTLAKCTA